MNVKLYTARAISDDEGVVDKLVYLGATHPAKSALCSQMGVGGEGELGHYLPISPTATAASWGCT